MRLDLQSFWESFVDDYGADTSPRVYSAVQICQGVYLFYFDELAKLSRRQDKQSCWEGTIFDYYEHQGKIEELIV